MVTIRTVSFNIKISAFLYSWFSTANCSTLALRSKIGDSNRSVGPYNSQCQEKLLQNTGKLLTANRGVTRGGGASVAAAKDAGKWNFKVKEKMYQMKTNLILRQIKRNFLNNCDFVLKFVISISGGLYGYSPRAPKIWLCHWTKTNNPWQTCVRNLTLMSILTKASK